MLGTIYRIFIIMWLLVIPNITKTLSVLTKIILINNTNWIIWSHNRNIINLNHFQLKNIQNVGSVRILPSECIHEKKKIVIDWPWFQIQFYFHINKKGQKRMIHACCSLVSIRCEPNHISQNQRIKTSIKDNYPIAITFVLFWKVKGETVSIYVILKL